MQSQIRDEEEKRKDEVKVLSAKDWEFWETIDRRGIFRSLRNTLYKLKLPMPIPMNLVDFSAEYCKKYGDPSVEQIEEQPTSKNYVRSHR